MKNSLPRDSPINQWEVVWLVYISSTIIKFTKHIFSLVSNTALLYETMGPSEGMVHPGSLYLPYLLHEVPKVAEGAVCHLAFRPAPHRRSSKTMSDE